MLTIVTFGYRLLASNGNICIRFSSVVFGFFGFFCTFNFLVDNSIKNVYDMFNNAKPFCLTRVSKTEKYERNW